MIEDAAELFVDPAAGDLHLRAAVPKLTGKDEMPHAQRDFDGQQRGALTTDADDPAARDR